MASQGQHKVKKSIMLIQQYCQKFIEKALPTIHKKRRKSLTNQVVSLLNNAKLTLTSLGRHAKGNAKVKHKINMAWRFLKNPGVSQDSFDIYQGISASYLSTLAEFNIAVDWSGCCSNEHFLLRASLLYKGRSISLYNEVHPEDKLEDEKVHCDFLDKLYSLLPQGKRVTIVTDAGFKTPWFHKVAQLGWYFMGRVRGRIMCKLHEEYEWVWAKELHQKVKRGETKCLGKGLLGKTSKTQLEVCYIAHFGFSKGRKKAKKDCRYPDAEKMYSSLNSEPWIIATNIQDNPNNENKKPVQIAKIVYNCYKKRMQIEQNFRDDKSPRFGFAWRESRTRDIAKIRVLCLIATIAALVQWLIGFAAEQQKMQYEFQANTVKTHRVLSFLFLGKQVIMHTLERLNIQSLFDAIEIFQAQYRAEIELEG